MIKLNKLSISNELIYVLYITSGSYKVFVPIPIDLTLLLFSMLSFLLVKNLIYDNSICTISRYSLVVLCVFICFYALLFLSLIYSTSIKYSYIKLFYFHTVVLAFLFPFFYTKFKVKRFFQYFIMYSVFLAGLYVPVYNYYYKRLLIDYQENLNSITMSYLSIAYVIGLAAVIIIYSNVFNKFKWVLGLFLIGSLFLLGARGPILSLFMTLVFFVFLFMFGNLKISKNTFGKVSLSKLVGIIICCCIIYYLVVYLDSYQALERTYARILSLGGVSEDQSVNGRIKHFNFVLNNYSLNPFFGFGVGSYGIEFSGYDEKYYPHNLLLEILFEQGIVGLILMLIFLMLIVIKLYRMDIYFQMIFLYLIINALKSLSLADHRFMFAFFSIILISKVKLGTQNTFSRKE